MSVEPTVLVVDDEKEVTEMHQNVLADRYTVEIANSGEEALAKADASTDVVLLDRRMPGMSGDEVLTKLREQSIDCRIVMVTAINPDMDLIEMEFDEYLVKPVTREQLNSVVEQMLSRDRLDEQIQRMASIASKLATLESKLDYKQLENSEEYASLRSEFEGLRQEVTLPEETDDPYAEATMEKLEALVQEYQ